MSILAFELNDVLTAVAVEPPARVAFREERHNPMLREPLVLSGYLEYLGPGSLNMIIESPFRESYLITSSELEIRRAGDIQKLPLKRARSLQSMLDAIEAIIAGDEKRLADAFDLQLSGEASDWSIRLTPTSKRVARHLGGLSVTGDASTVQSIRIDLEEGEWHLIQLLHAGADS